MNQTSKNKNKLYWRVTVAVTAILILITFTPLVIAPGKTDPKLFSMPYTLWISILITILIVILTYIGGRIHLKDNGTNEKE
jgi:Na+/melibiose symporter-like transporter